MKRALPKPQYWHDHSKQQTSHQTCTAITKGLFLPTAKSPALASTHKQPTIAPSLSSSLTPYRPASPPIIFLSLPACLHSRTREPNRCSVNQEPKHSLPPVTKSSSLTNRSRIAPACRPVFACFSHPTFSPRCRPAVFFHLSCLQKAKSILCRPKTKSPSCFHIQTNYNCSTPTYSGCSQQIFFDRSQPNLFSRSQESSRFRLLGAKIAPSFQ